MSLHARPRRSLPRRFPTPTVTSTEFGGKFVPEALYAALHQLEQEFRRRPGRPGASPPSWPACWPTTPAGRARSPRRRGSADRTARRRPTIVLKREDLNHTGSHKINNVLGQALLTRRMGKTRVIAETGAGQHGVATATAAALFGLECTVYMGKVDTERQALNVARMRLLGAEVIAVESGTQTLKDAMNDAMRDWVASVDHTHYLIGTVAGPHPFPMLVREFQRVISTEARAQLLDRYGRLPDAVAACVGGGSNALGIFADFIPDAEVGAVRLRGRRRRGGDRPARRHHLRRVRSGCCTACGPTCCRTRTARPGSRTPSRPAWTIPGVGPEHSWLAAHRPGALRADHRRRGDGGLPAAVPDRGHRAGHRVGPRAGRCAQARPAAARGADGEPPLILVSLSGRGDKDVDTAIKWFDLDTTGTGSESGDPIGTDPADVEGAPSGDRRPVHRRGGRAVSDLPSRSGTAARSFADAKADGPRRAGRLPARRLPDRAPSRWRALRALTGEGDSPGVDLVEVGMPYSDPMMDGVTIQRAGTRALERGVRTRDAFAAVETVAGAGTPAVVMTYWNLIEHYGPDALRPRPRRGRRIRRDHPRPDPGRGGGVDRGLGRPRAGPDLPGLAVLDRRAAGHARSRPAAAGSTRPR